MGVDYDTGHAVALYVDDMVKIINGNNKKQVIEILQRFHDNTVAGECASGKAKTSIKVLDGINPRIKLADIKYLLSEYHNVEGEAGKYEGDCHFANGLDGYDLMEMWEPIIEASGVELPGLAGIQIFDSYRKHGGCQIGVPSFLFDPDDCYEQTLNEQGKSLNKLSGGYLDDITWTDVSY